MEKHSPEPLDPDPSLTPTGSDGAGDRLRCTEAPEPAGLLPAPHTDLTQGVGVASSGPNSRNAHM